MAALDAVTAEQTRKAAMRHERAKFLRRRRFDLASTAEAAYVAVDSSSSLWLLERRRGGGDVKILLSRALIEKETRQY